MLASASAEIGPGEELGGAGAGRALGCGIPKLLHSASVLPVRGNAGQAYDLSLHLKILARSEACTSPLPALALSHQQRELNM